MYVLGVVLSQWHDETDKQNNGTDLAFKEWPFFCEPFGSHLWTVNLLTEFGLRDTLWKYPPDWTVTGVDP